MTAQKIASRYAKALHHSAPKVQRESILSNLQETVQLFEKFPKFVSFLKSPEIDKKDKEKALKKIFVSSTDPIYFRFLSFLIEKGRFNCLPEITEEYHEIFRKDCEVLDADLITAVTIEDSLREAIKKKLEKIYQKTIDLHHKIDPKILGGAILVIGNRMIDFSIKENLSRLKEKLLATTSKDSS